MQVQPIIALWRLMQLAPRGRLILLIAAMTLVGLTEGFGILMLVPLLQTLGGGGAANPVLGGFALPALSLTTVLALFTGLTALRAAAQFGQTILSTQMQHELVDEMRLRCFGGLLHAEWRWLAQRRSADHASLLVTNIGRIGMGLNQALALASAGFSLLACLAAALALSWKLAAFAGVGGAIILSLFSGMQQQALRLGQDLGTANRGLQGHIQEGLAGIRLTKILRNEDRHLSGFNTVLETLRTQQMAFMISSAWGGAALQVAGAAMLAASLYCGVVWLQLSYAVLLPLVFIFSRLVPTLGGIQRSYHYWLHAVPALAETQQLLTDTAQSAEPVNRGARVPLPLTRELRLDAVSFTYGGRQRPALDRVTVSVPANTTLAIMGPSGAGKSTLADIVMGLIEPDDGQVTVDGMPITGQARQRWRQSVAYVQQDAFLFNDTLRANLLWSRPDASEADMQRALSTAAADFVSVLPLGLDTFVGDGGVRLSGGERQRIALARALLGSPSLLILDEATSALDPANETAIRTAIANLHGNVTIIIIGHRLAMLDQADQIIEIKRGQAEQQAPKAAAALAS